MAAGVVNDALIAEFLALEEKEQAEDQVTAEDDATETIAPPAAAPAGDATAAADESPSGKSKKGKGAKRKTKIHSKAGGGEDDT